MADSELLFSGKRKVALIKNKLVVLIGWLLGGIPLWALTLFLYENLMDYVVYISHKIAFISIVMILV